MTYTGELKTMRKQKGFSLIELLIVVAIILIIAAIAIPNLLKARIAANEASAVGSVRTIVTSEMTYATSNPDTGYTSLANLGTAGLIDSVVSAGTKSGYALTVGTSKSAAAGATAGNDQFVAEALPSTTGTTGNRGFCATENGVLHYTADGKTAGGHDACSTSTYIVQ